MRILREYDEGQNHVIEYTEDGETVLAKVENLITSQESSPAEVSLQEQINQLKNDNLILMDALATVFEELLNLESMQSGGTV